MSSDIVGAREFHREYRDSDETGWNLCKLCRCGMGYACGDRQLLDHIDGLESEISALRQAIDTVLLKDGHFAFCTGGTEPENGCMPTCVELRAALNPPEEPAP